MAPEPSLETRLAGLMSSLRPRPGFESELWGRLNRGSRWRLVAAGWGRPRLYAPLAAATLSLLVLAAFAAHSLVSLAPTGSYGVLPPPSVGAAIELDSTLPDAVPNTGTGAPVGPVAYFGPANLSLAPGLSVHAPGRLPVFRYTEPSPQRLAQLTRQLGSGGVVLGSAASGREPIFQLQAPPSIPAAPPPPRLQAQTLALGFLDRQGVIANWAQDVSVEVTSGAAMVHLIRQFQVPGVGWRPEVDSSGTSAGADVEFLGDRVARAEAPVPAALERADYTSRPQAQVLAAALKDAPEIGGTSLWSPPHVVLDHSRLVYLAVSAGDRGFFEPVWLFTGSFEVDGIRYQKRVLVPAVAAVG
ncbi:MAG TPA: hypothetical protein VNI34_03145 [Candidatus Nitrosotalea sp.]|nr:hypothetical protein [Candidatus Nitrosotalea sp.]